MCTRLNLTVSPALSEPLRQHPPAGAPAAGEPRGPGPRTPAPAAARGPPPRTTSSLLVLFAILANPAKFPNIFVTIWPVFG